MSRDHPNDQCRNTMKYKKLTAVHHGSSTPVGFKKKNVFETTDQSMQ
jgi:hypothetical protein